ncbi:MAG TPA: D-amino acid aminotransferase [Desulfosarcina sp.]|nr:D-amino acid aminotransferase [Desulfosarcina sp.]
MPELAYVNGKITPIENAMVSIEDRGYQFGDGAYEVVASYEGRLFMLEAHLDRLERSLRELAYDPVPREGIRAAIGELLERSGYDRAGVYVQITRGVAPRNHAFTPGMPHQIVMTVRPVKEVPAQTRDNGATAITVRDTRWQRCDIKTVQLLSNSLAKHQALQAGCDDAIFVSEGNIVREGTSSNLFIVTGGRLTTHPLTDNILPGITRMVVMDLCQSAGLAVEEAYFGPDALLAADEAFFTGTITEVLGIVRIDGRTVGDGKVGPTTRRLYDMLRKRALAGSPV